MAKRKTALKTYATHVKSALEKCSDPAWLGEHSPLATPYFLGEQLHGTEATAAARGAVLLQEIERTLQTLWRGTLPADATHLIEMVEAEEDEGGRGARYDCLILELNYLKRIFRPAPKSQAEIYNDILHISRPTHDRHLAAAVERLGTILLQRVRPAVRPEQPQLAPTLIGRDEIQTQILADLDGVRSVSLSGPGGVGKTTLGAAITESWHSPAVFWFTFRSTFNDHMDSLFFALGHFLHTWGASTLWHQLIADGGQLRDANLALGLLRTDLAALEHRPLLCFDEMDVLRPATADQPSERHVQLLELIDSLRGDTPLLLVGQRPFWESDAVYTLAGLAENEVDALLTSFSVPHGAEDVARLHYYSGGNPRLVELCAAIYGAEDGKPFHQVLDELPGSPTLLPLWHRLARRLLHQERQLLQWLSVFRSPAPLDIWQGQEEALGEDAGETEVEAEVNQSSGAEAVAQLAKRHLILLDQRGGVTLLPALREVIYGELSVEQREIYHQRAAHVRAERGEYTAAAWHLLKSDQPEAAVALWYPQRRVEINRGRAGTALAIFEQISARRLSKKRARELALLRSELYELAGQPEKVVKTLGEQPWPSDEVESIDAQVLWANALHNQGQIDGALDRYAQGLALQRQLMERAVQVHTLRSRAHLHQREMPGARRAMEQARYQVESLQGVYHDYSGDYDRAFQHYQAGLEIAQELEDPDAVAYIQHHLALLTGRREGLSVAAEYYAAAMKIYQENGNLYRMQLVRSNLANTQIQSGEFAAAVESAREALRFFQRIGDPVRIAQNASNLAEALVELDQLEEAESHAMLVLDQEEPHSHPYALYTMGTARRKAGNLEESELYYDQARKVAEMNEDAFLLAYAWEALARVQWQQQKPKAARHALHEAEKLFTTLKIDAKIADVLALKETMANAS